MTNNKNNDIDSEKKELFSHYKKYIDNQNKEELLCSLKLKEDKIKTISPLSLSEKFKGFVDYQYQKQLVKDVILEKICSDVEHSKLQEINEYYFKMAGKMIRPHFLIQLANYIYECLEKNDKSGKYSTKFVNSELFKNKVVPFAACIEALHNASLLQDDIIDNSDTRRSQISAHNRFGIRNTVFSSNIILSKAAIVITDIEVDHLSEVFSKIVFDLTYGEYEQSINKPFIIGDKFDEIDSNLKNYMIKTYYKTASLIALSFKGLALIMNLNHNQQATLFNLGLHLGTLFQVVDDIIDVQSSSATLKKPAFKDISEGVVNTHVIYEMNGKNKDIVLELIKRKFKGKDDIELIKSILSEGNGIIKSQNLALDHLISTLTVMDDEFFTDSEIKQNLFKSIIFMFNRNF